MITATDVTVDHYQRPGVKETVLRCSQDGEAWRCLNGDQGWYITAENGGVRLRRPEDYDKTTGKFRTLYWSLDLFEPEVQNISDQWDEVRKRPVHPIGTLRECRAYSLGVDIDAVGHNAFDDPDITKALEEAATFLIDRLRAEGIEKSVYALCSGGGIYVLIHHALFTAKSEWSGEAREQRFLHLLETYNAFIRDTAEAFFEAHPEYVGRVVFDALNGQKRKFKTIFSIHKTVPAAVVPLDPQCIKISKEDATIPLSSGVLERGAEWYRDYDLAEKARLQALLQPYDEAAKKKLERRKTETGSYDLFRRDAPTLPDEWCPLMQRIAGGVTAGEIGRHAALGNLARHLYADGWSMEAAFRLWSPLADQAGVEYRIFDTSFGEISEARCKVINERRAGYPASSLGGTRFAEACATCPRRKAGRFPSDYAHLKAEEATTSGFTLTDFGEWTTIKKKVIDEETGERTTVDVQKFEFSRDRAARSFSEKMNLAMETIGGDIHFFDGQIYRPEGAVQISDELYSIAKDYVNRFAVAEVLERLRAKYGLHLVRFDPNPYLLGVRNGVIDLRTGEFRDYRPADLLTDKIDVEYDPAAKCPRFLKFLEEIQPNVIDRLTLIDWFAATAIRKPLPYVLFLLGLGRNGKGIYERLMKRFFGERSFSAMNLDEINKSVFAAGSLRNKRGWIASEQQGSNKRPSIGTNFIKLVSGAGTVDADVKNRARVYFEAYFQAIIDTNAMPAIDDTSIGWMERFCKQSFPYVYVENPMGPLERKKDPHLFEKLTTYEELSGILNLVIERAKEICKTETIIKRPAADLFAEYIKQSSSLSTFWDEFCDYTPETPSLQIPTDTIYEAYKRWCSHLVGEVVNEKYFGAFLKKQCGGFNSGRKTVKDATGKEKKVRFYRGLLFDEEKVNKAIAALDSEMTIKDHQGPSKDHHYPPKNNISKDIGPSGPSNLWNSIIERFGDKEENSLHIERISENDGFDGPDGHAIDIDGPSMVLDGPSDGPNVAEFVAGEGEDHQTIAEALEVDERRQAEEAERTATPEPKGEEGDGRPPTAEEAEVLEDVARKILQNWPGIAEARLWELARGKLGSPLPLAVVKAWLKESGYIDTGQRLNGSPLWNPPVGAVG